MDQHECKENYFDPNVIHRKRTYHKDDKKNTFMLPNYTVDIFMDICKKLDYTSKEYLKMVLPIDETKESLILNDQIIILNYIKQIVIYLIKSKLELEDKLCNQQEGKQFESQLQTMEADIRQYIRIQQQLQLIVEQQTTKLEEFEYIKLKQEQIITDLTLKLQVSNNDLKLIKNENYDLKFNLNPILQQKTITEPIQSSLDQLDNLQLFTLVETSPTKNNNIQIQHAIRRGKTQQLSKEPQKPKGDNTPQISKVQEKTKENNNGQQQSPEQLPRKFSQPNYMELNALRQLVKKPCPISQTHRQDLNSFRSNSQEATRNRNTKR